jgi:hypothetical protein
MRRRDVLRAADPAGYATGLTAIAPSEPMHHHEIVRTDQYRGHEIVVRTTYEVEIDGKQITAELHVDNAGNVMCHAMPVYRTASMTELMRILVDVFPDDFPTPPQRPQPTTTDHENHHHHMGGE